MKTFVFALFFSFKNKYWYLSSRLCPILISIGTYNLGTDSRALGLIDAPGAQCCAACASARPRSPLGPAQLRAQREIRWVH